jgi:hypothetical protein
MKLIIERDKWLRGEGMICSRLLRKSDGKKCCLGFYALQCGADPNDIRGVATPTWINAPSRTALRESHGSWLFDDVATNMLPNTSKSCELLMIINDDENLEDSEREQKIAAIFAEYEVEVKFV